MRTKPSQKRSPVKSLSELQKIVEKSVFVDLDIDGQQFRVECRRLRPAETAALESVLAEAIPPIIRGKTMEEDRHDYTNQAYLEKKRQTEIEARAMGLYWCVPVFAQEKPGLSDRKLITEFVQSKLNDQVLNVLWEAIRNGGVSLAELVNFTSTNA